MNELFGCASSFVNEGGRLPGERIHPSSDKDSPDDAGLTYDLVELVTLAPAIFAMGLGSNEKPRCVRAEIAGLLAVQPDFGKAAGDDRPALYRQNSQAGGSQFPVGQLEPIRR